MSSSEDIVQLKNLGSVSAERLRSVGIATPAKLRELGAAAAYMAVKEAFPLDISIVLLWALQGGLMDMHWQQLPAEIKQELRQQIVD